jgi:hypothetical protein
MVKAQSLQRSGSSDEKTAAAKYDRVKALVTIAKKNGWDLESMGLVLKDLPASKSLSLTRKQVIQQNRLLKNILKRFSRILTPPVPLDLETHIKSKDETALLPWEAEALQKVSQWRNEISKVKPQIMEELCRALE